MDLFLPLLAIATMIYLAVKFSGTPYRSRGDGAKLKKVACVFITWTALRIFVGILNLFQFYSAYTVSTYYNSFNSDEDTISFMISIVMIIGSEVL
jgi:hypothetical protein